MLRLGAERDEVAVVDDQRGSPTFVGHLAEATRELVDADLPRGLWHVAADGECTWADFAEAIFEEAGLETRVRRISTAELERPAPRPAYSVLRSERAGAPQLPHWREGLRACLARDRRLAFRPMRLLVTGGAGFIGSNFVHYWLGRHPDDHVVVYDLLTYAGNRESLAPVEERIVFVEGDICDRDLAETALRENDVDTVVNFAAESHNSLAVVDPTRFFRTNVLGTQTLLDASRAAGVERFHHVSTCEVYGDLDLDTDEVFTEESPYRPRTPYNASKAGADHAVRAYFETFELPITITNCSNNYGPFQFPEKVIPLFTTNAIDDEPLPMYASTQNKREWLHVLDHCEAIDLVLHEGRPGETYNVGSGIEATIEEIADRVLELTGKPASLKKIVPDRPGHDRRYLLDATKIREELGWTAARGFDEGLAETVAWYEANRDWWEPLKARAPVEESAWK